MLHSKKNDIESLGVDSLIRIIESNYSLNRLSIDDSKSQDFWDYLERNYIFTHDQFLNLVTWMETRKKETR